MNKFEKYIQKYDDIENNLSNNYNKNEILSNLKEELDDINVSKSLVNKSKALMIKINKSKNIIDGKKNLEFYLNSKIDELNQFNSYVFDKIIRNYKDYLSINYDKLNYKIEKIIKYSDSFSNLDFYCTINYKKNKKNNLQKLINAINFKNSYSFYPKIMFLEYFNNLDNNDKIINFIKKFNYTYIPLSINNNKILKRGFIFEIQKNNIPYILKFQPNKSFIEILINKFLSKYTNLKEFILYPEYFFVNKNNSYFYIIEKYDFDLFTYIKKKKNPLNVSEILSIIKFVINVIYHLHNLDIIYADLKLENIIVNIKNNKINDMKIIDFDVSLFDEIPSEFINFDEKILKLLNNKKPRGTKFYQSSNNVMNKSNDIYSIGTFITILLYKNTMKILHENNNISENLLSRITSKLSYYKNNLDDNLIKIKLMKYLFRIYNDRRFKYYWDTNIKIKNIYIYVKKCITQTVDINELYSFFS